MASRPSGSGSRSPSLLVGDHDVAVAALGRLDELGVTVTLDDFGTGYSSLSYLRRLPTKILKIDREFVSGASATGSEAVLAKASVALEHRMGLRVVAEGVGSHEQLAHLAANGTDFGQGYLLGRPVSSESLVWRLRKQHLQGCGSPWCRVHPHVWDECRSDPGRRGSRTHIASSQ